MGDDKIPLKASEIKMLTKQPQGNPHDKREHRKNGHRYKIRADVKTECRAQTLGTTR
jgi:hypothetical protein